MIEIGTFTKKTKCMVCKKECSSTELSKTELMRELDAETRANIVATETIEYIVCPDCANKQKLAPITTISVACSKCGRTNDTHLVHGDDLTAAIGRALSSVDHTCSICARAEGEHAGN